MKDKIKSGFDRAASSYDLVASVQKKSADYLTALLLPHVKSPDSILDVGTGTGLMVQALQKIFPKANYTLNDLSPKMLEHAASCLAPPPQLIEGDAETMAFTGAPFSLITANLVTQWFTHLEKGLGNLWRQGKALAFSSLMEGSFTAWEEACKHRGRSCGLHAYPSLAALQAICQRLAPSQLVFDTRQETLYFAHGRDFVHYLKSLGAVAARKGHSPSSLRPIFEDLKDGFVINYEIFYAVLIHKEAFPCHS